MCVCVLCVCIHIWRAEEHGGHDRETSRGHDRDTSRGHDRETACVCVCDDRETAALLYIGSALLSLSER